MTSKITAALLSARRQATAAPRRPDRRHRHRHHTECRRLGAEMVKNADKCRVLHDIGEITSMKAVAIIHGGKLHEVGGIEETILRSRRGAGTWQNSGKPFSYCGH